ncbi:MAG: MBL fold metallo-hydrolase, partial [Candidatus Hodarchaeota archaeon]
SFAVWTDPDRKDVQLFTQWVKKEEGEEKPLPIAGGGLCLYIRATVGDETRTILYDAAESYRTMENNVDALGLDLSKIEAVVLSHGHWDHFGGLLWAIDNIGRKDLSVYVHPRMLLKKGFEVKKPEGTKINEMTPMPPADVIAKRGGRVTSSAKPILIAEKMFLRTGEVPRITSHEKGMKGHKVFLEGQWKDDSTVIEDVSLVAKVKGKGLVVISGCSHAGIINIIHEAQRIAGGNKIHALIGGLHLAGRVTKETMHETVKMMKKIRPFLLVPCHCTGWRARHLMSAEMPEEYVEGSVGHKYIISSGDAT